MGRYERRVENSRGTGETYRSAETALRAVTEELQIMQRSFLKTLQEDIKRLQGEKNRLADDIKRLQEEKEQLNQERVIGEQQALVRQLAQVLANHISSQLQSNLETLANQAIERASSNATLNTAQNNNDNASQLFDSLDDTLTLTFNTLQQELKNYQNSISEQMSRMKLQQHQGEAILAELINRLRGELEKTTKTPVETIKAAPPHEYQPTQTQQVNISEPVTKLQPTENSSEIVTKLQPAENGFEIVTQLQPIDNSSETVTKLQPTENGSEIITQLQPIDNRSETVTKLQPAENGSEIVTQLQSIDNSSETATKLQPVDNSIEQPSSLNTVPQEAPDVSDVSPSKSPERETIFTPPVTSVSAPPPEPQPAIKPIKPSSKQVRFSSLSIKGLLLIVLSTLILSVYNVAIKVIFLPAGSQILGVSEVDNLLVPTLGNALLILMLRMLVVVPLMLLLTPILYPQIWQDVQNIVDSLQGKSSSADPIIKRVFILSVVSGFFLFLSQLLIYLAISQIPTAAAITLYFIYPIVTGILSWSFFGDRPTSWGGGAIAAISLGELLVLSGFVISGRESSLGSTAAIIAGISFAIYVIISRLCAAKLHPITCTIINFATMLLLSLVSLILPLPPTSSLVVNPAKLLEVILSAFILGVLTLLGYLLNHFGVDKLGGTRAAIFGATIPALTVILAGLILQESLLPIQVVGVLAVTFGAAAFSWEQIRNRLNASHSS
jgi:drug/metabolite transporter (DMT)-like permease